MLNTMHSRNINSYPRTCGIKALGFITKLLRIFYCSFVYYFLPFMILLLPFFVSQNKNLTIEVVQNTCI